MRVSFDIDDTLVCRHPGARAEAGKFAALVHAVFGDPLRRGTRELVNELRARKWSVWIYTTSNRDPWHIRLWLFLQGIRVDGVVNDERHQEEVSKLGFRSMPSKFPPAFDIDLHIDNSQGVVMEGREFGFRVLWVQPNDARWAEKVLAAADALEAQAEPSPEGAA